MEPSLPGDFEQKPAYAHHGSGAQNNNTGDGYQYNNTGQQFIGTNHIVYNHTITKTIDDIDRSCLRYLRCPDTLVVKSHLKESKDKLFHKSIDWILQNPQYVSWKDGDDVCLLWVKGGAGKGKTMMAIGLIERLLFPLELPHDAATVVTYFFCQNADYELNTLEAIMKGLILRLVNQQKELGECLRRHWDTVADRFVVDVTSWRTLWDILLEMLHQCKCRKVYVIVDALDECHHNGMADFLRLIVHTGLDFPSKIKWLLTSRPLDSAKQELLAGSDQVMVSFELNSRNVSEAVTAYIANKVAELAHRNVYGPILRQKIQIELTEKAEDTYLWVSLVCKRLKNVRRDEVLATIQDLPPGLHPFYNQILNQLSLGEPAIVKGCMRLLKVMMLAYRPLNVAEVASVSGLPDEWDTTAIEALVDRCASFFKMRENNIEFVHQSARDYLAGMNGQSILNSFVCFEHSEIAVSCLSYLTDRLKVNLADLPYLNSTQESIKRNLSVISVDYAATFWIQHLEAAKQTTLVQNALTEQGELGIFLHAKLLEWLECLSLLDKLPRAIEALRILVNIVDAKRNLSISMLVQDATRFLLRHYQTLATWPIQVYSSAIVFSPQTSRVRMDNIDKVPTWLRKLPQMEDAWTSLIQTFILHSDRVRAVKFSPNGKQIASGSRDGTIKLWCATAGTLQKTLTSHSKAVMAIAFSPDGTQIASGSYDNTIKLWDTTTGELLKKIVGFLGWVTAIAFSPDGKQIVSFTSTGNTIKVWDTSTCELQKILVAHSCGAMAVVFSPNGKQIALGSTDGTIKFWDATAGTLQKTLTSHSKAVMAIVFSPGGRQIASGSYDNTIKLWDTTKGELQKTLIGHLDSVEAIAFSSDGTQIASGSYDNTIKLWDTTTGDLQKTLIGHSSWVIAVAFSRDIKQVVSGSRDGTINLWDATQDDLQETLADLSASVTVITFSPDGKQIASGSIDGTIKLWDVTTRKLRKTLTGHSSSVRAVSFSPNGKQITSGSRDTTVKLWDTTTGDLQKTLTGHSECVVAVAFSSDGTQIASGSYDNTIKLWETTKGELQKTLIGHSDLVEVIAFSPDGKQIASGSRSKTIKLWDVTTGKLQKTLTGHSSSVRAVAFSPDGKQIASGSEDQRIKLWDIAEVLKTSRLFGNTISSRLKFRAWQEIKTSQTVSSLNSAIDGECLSTNLVSIKVKSAVSTQSPKRKLLENLLVSNQWIYYGPTPVLLLSSNLKPVCFDTVGDRLAIGLLNGRVLIFYIDRESLHCYAHDHIDQHAP